ncbi:uncharacterized protein LOC143863741 [Tasmannia lanceolata]|uniref:uncharacterized protein LOC143863741 n=1 Tax=Tasmannia lanceolata TaxID=3420 RepID=UPI0040630F39
MLKHGGCTNVSTIPLWPVFSTKSTSTISTPLNISMVLGTFSKIHVQRTRNVLRHARRRVTYEDEGEDEGEDEDYGQNSEIAMLESYSESAKDEVLLVRAIVDDQEEEVIIFKGFSSSLSFRTSSDPSRSVLPARAVIKTIDRIKGPFDPSNIEYLEKGLTWEAFKGRLQPNKL